MRNLPWLHDFFAFDFRDLLDFRNVAPPPAELLGDGWIGDGWEETSGGLGQGQRGASDWGFDHASQTQTPHPGGSAAGGTSSGAGSTVGGIVPESTTGVDTTLALGVRDSGNYGNNFNGSFDADGVVTASFAGTGEDLVLTFGGYDIDTADEVEVLLNGTSLGYLGAGVNLGLSDYQFTIAAAQQQAGDNVISFVQRGNVAWTWGVTDLLLEKAGPVTTLALGVTDSGIYGNNFNGSADGDGIVSASFTGTGTDLSLTFDGYDIDYPDEVEVLLNGTSLGFMTVGPNNGLAAQSFMITAAQQQAGENVISFVQRDDVNFTWGVTNILLDDYQPPPPPAPDFALSVGLPETGAYGNNFNGSFDTDGVVTASFDGTGEDLVLSFNGYDIDTADEVEVLLNGTSLGYLGAGVNNGLSSYHFAITAAQQQSGANTISFVQRGDVAWTWGVTGVLLESAAPVTTLALGVTDSGSYGNNFNGSIDGDGIVSASFTGTGNDLTLTFDGYDIDYPDEVEVLLNGTSLGFMTVGPNNGLAAQSFMITAAQQQAGDNVISFVQRDDVNFTWGVTNILLDDYQPPPPPAPDFALSVGVPETGAYGNNFNGSFDADGVVTASFDGTGEDLVLSFEGYDIDTADEVEVLLNGTSLGYLGAGVNLGLSDYHFTITAAQQQSGANTISFVQRGDVAWTWGVTDILLESAGPVTTLEVGQIDTGIYGNNFNGSIDGDGVVSATFTGTGEDLQLTFDGYDIDYADEVEVLLNGNSLGFMTVGPNNGLAPQTFLITAAQQQAGTNTISFVQRDDVNFTWGVTNILIAPPPATFTPTDTAYGEQWHLKEIGLLERVWADYTGAGVSVGIYDDGLQYTHHDLDGNYDAAKQVVVNGTVVDPIFGDSQHGTAVAGVIAAEADGVGSVGVAFDASITGVNIFTGAASANTQDLSNFAEAMMQMANFDIVNHSWGWTPPFEGDNPPKEVFYATTLPTLENAVDNGRGGLGTILVKSAGNGSESSQGELLDSSRFTINVGATDNDGDIAWYSNHGANLLLTAPSSGDPYLNLGIVTTDLLGTAGYASGDYTGSDGFTGFGGTSSAAPVVSGVVALMLEANPELGWRDVQSILAYSATHAGTPMGDPVSPFLISDEEHSWRFNGADNWNGGGLHVSEDYGFGDVDAFNAVRMAEVWDYFGDAQTSANEFNVTLGGTPNLNIGSGQTIDLDLTGVNFYVDQAEVSVSLSSSDVDMYLSSPDGTVVELYRAGDAPAGTLDWSFGAQIFRGEAGDGIWSLEIVNTGSSAVLNSYSVDWWGREDGAYGFDAADDVYHFTDEIFAKNIYDDATGQFTALADDAARTTLTDSDGGTDWLDMAAMTGNLDVSLAAGGGGTSSGQTFVTFAPGVEVENAIGGDGWDRLSGNAADNILIGMRGNDQLFGQDGADRLSGGTGNDELWGGQGSDLFVFEDGFGQDVIHDFEASLTHPGGADKVDFAGLSEAADFAAVISALTDSAQGAVYDKNGDGLNALLFEGVSVADLSANDFLFV